MFPRYQNFAESTHITPQTGEIFKYAHLRSTRAMYFPEGDTRVSLMHRFGNTMGPGPKWAQLGPRPNWVNGPKWVLGPIGPMSPNGSQAQLG